MANFIARFYRVSQCGYFRWGESDPSIASLEETLSSLATWSSGKSLLATRVEGIGEKLPSYLFDIKNYGRCWVITLWNEVPTEDGSVTSVMGTDIVGSADVQATAIAAGAIPGFPSYAAFFPEYDLYISLKNADVIAGTEQVKNYFQTFLSRSAPWVSVDVTDPANPEIVGYVDLDDHERAIHTDLYPRFSIQVQKTGDERAEMIRKVTSIRKVIRVNEINTLRAPDRALYQRALAIAGLEGTPQGRTVRIRQEIPVRLTRDQLVALLNSVEPELIPKRNDVAVVFDRDQREHWLSGVIPNLELDLDIDKDEGVFPAIGLARRLAARRTALIEAAGL